MPGIISWHIDHLSNKHGIPPTVRSQESLFDYKNNTIMIPTFFREFHNNIISMCVLHNCIA